MQTSFPIKWGLLPNDGPLYLPFTFDFSSQASFEEDLQKELDKNVIDIVQAVWVDNSDNVNELTITFAGSGQRIVVPAGASSVWPVFAPTPYRFTVATSAVADLEVTLGFINVPSPLAQFGPITANVTTGQGSFTDRGIASLSGASESLMAANALRKRMIVQCPVSNVNPVYINFGAAAAADQTSIQLLPGGSWDSNFGPVPVQQIFVIGTATESVIAKEM